MSDLITYAQQQAIKPISSNLQYRFEQLSIEVQDRELKKLLGLKMYQDLLKNAAETDYEALIEGSEFTYEGFEYTHKGLRYVLAYLIYASYIMDSRYNDTFAGFTQKNIPESTRSQYGELKALKQTAMEQAMSYFDEVKLFLDYKSSTFAYWGEIQGRRKLSTPVISKVGGGDNSNNDYFCCTSKNRYI